MARQGEDLANETEQGLQKIELPHVESRARLHLPTALSLQVITHMPRLNGTGSNYLQKITSCQCGKGSTHVTH